MHTGIDLQKNRKGGDLVLASRPGKVVSAQNFSGYGKAVMILHKDGYRSRYAHLRGYKVKVGQKVKAKQPIGIVGQTGRATTPHLHFEILTPDGKFIDPAFFLSN
jgi:murein DD-endopeptidase MepM/ murein hydrolase activator NlpD